jgi:hypothetical protein
MNESLNSRSFRSRAGGAPLREDPVNLVSESIPNYAKFDHFAADPFGSDDRSNQQDSILPSAAKDRRDVD